MTTIHVPRPPESAWNPGRAASSLLRTQVEHVHFAEKRLPVRYHTDIYVNAIHTEGEAAEYIGRVTSAIYRAHQDAAKRRARSAPIPGRVLALAAESEIKPRSKTRRKASSGKTKPSRDKRDSRGKK